MCKSVHQNNVKCFKNTEARKDMKKSSVALRLRKSRNMFVLIAVAPIAAMILMVILFVYGELQGIKATYHIDSEKIDSP